MNTEDLHSLFRLHPAVSTDSRSITRGCLFFALKGEHFNGNAYALQALEAGAAYAIVDDPSCIENDRCILVRDVLCTLQNLAWHHRNQFDIPVLGITGSNGKTTTKELILSVLSQKFRTLATRGNLNNHIGVPLTLLGINGETEIAIIEMGANHQKEIELLCSIARPTHGLITNVGKAHLEGFGSLEGVMKGKKELYDSLSINNGLAFVNAENSMLAEMAKELGNIVWYGTGSADDICGKLIDSSPKLRFSWWKKGSDTVNTVEAGLAGEYNFENLLAAVCAGDHFGLDPARIAAGIASYTPSNNRSQEMNIGSNRVILDAYNANPGSMAAALRNLASRPGENKVAILGDMFELGKYSEEEHTGIISLLEQLDIQHGYLIGPEFCRHRKDSASLRFFESPEEADAWFRSHPFRETLILLKGSRAMQLEKLLGSMQKDKV